MTSEVPTQPDLVKNDLNEPGLEEDGESLGSALLNLGFYSFLLFTLPLGVFFMAKEWLIESGFPEIYITIGPAILSILSVNIIIILYVISAFRSERTAYKVRKKSD